ncbi:hypothetical protein [Pseudonocardia parietis]|uniref:Uncharacterized protein n=1 Tax=Pseudonocardia parietis TaxID=570936 RepID=A0ABS4VUM8_9PSEU|nr:hypothetical protein [Pseudonocardia parietis]MBP2367496.1 hypothetical protein [Pseudonocardia parietis]
MLWVVGFQQESERTAADRRGDDPAGGEADAVDVSRAKKLTDTS